MYTWSPQTSLPLIHTYCIRKQHICAQRSCPILPFSPQSINMHRSNAHILKPYIVCLQLLCIAYYLNIKLVPLPNDSIQLGWLKQHLLITLEMDEMKGRKPLTFKSMLCCASSYCHIISNNLLMGEPFFFLNGPGPKSMNLLQSLHLSCSKQKEALLIVILRQNYENGTQERDVMK